MFLIWFSRERGNHCAWREIYVVHRCFRRVNFFGKTCGMKRSISISELSAENDVAVVNAYGCIIVDNEDHVDDSTTEVFLYL